MVLCRGYLVVHLARLLGMRALLHLDMCDLLG